ncbi:hypothetical protein K461DRAFT_292130 [Myriangium duriaei CBS 260.36]|uniref:Uncharacterized protein n=1 Tax=Myriangium duriaei CBS 260.36 TaxID=1168546 RepID=A0A9P4J4G6_9PEZI|nr:hypothetical protein K461DRAFT_292130 [Myriangium duriaei CBS 260.36]
MQPLTLLLLAIIPAVIAHGSGPCYNHADPDRGIGNWCVCKDGSCWKDDPKTVCHPTSDKKIKCPE